MTENTTTFSYRVSPYRFTDRPAEMRRFLEAVGLQPVITKDSFAALRGAAGMVTVHPLATADTTDRVTTSFCLETDDARAAAEALALDGMLARWWDESFGRQAAVAGPGAEICLNEPMTDSYGYTAHRSDGPSGGFVVDVVVVSSPRIWTTGKRSSSGSDSPPLPPRRAGTSCALAPIRA